MTQQELMVHSAIANWKLAIKRTSGIFDGLTDEQFYAEIAPGRNRPVYLLGHLTAVHDAMLPLLGFGERMHPELDEIFLKTPDRSVDPLPALADLKSFWSEVNMALVVKFEAASTEDWIARHTAVTEEDYAADPSRNRFNVLLNRTAHTAMHMGQLLYARGT